VVGILKGWAERESEATWDLWFQEYAHVVWHFLSLLWTCFPCQHRNPNSIQLAIFLQGCTSQSDSIPASPCQYIYIFMYIYIYTCIHYRVYNILEALSNLWETPIGQIPRWSRSPEANVLPRLPARPRTESCSWVHGAVRDPRRSQVPLNGGPLEMDL
jgi:hypothetical protein